MKDLVAPADANSAVEHDIRADPGALAHFYVRSDNGIWADFDIWRESRTWGNDRRLVNHASLGFTVQRIVASATISPATLATHENFPMPRMRRSRDTSSSS